MGDKARARLLKNACNENAKQGIYLYSQSEDILAEENECCGNKLNGIYITSGTARTVNNTCKKNTYNGISSEGKNTQITAEGNQCIENSNNGVYIGNGVIGTVKDNTCNYNIYNGVSACGTMAGVTGNICNNNSGSGIYLFNGSSGLCSNNNCEGNSRYGITVADCWSVPVLKDNIYVNNGIEQEFYSQGLTGRVRELLLERNFKELENIGIKFRTEKVKTGDNKWCLKYFYEYLGEKWAYLGQEKKEEIFSILDEWKQEMPESVIPRIVSAIAHIDIAWFARGSDWANTVKEDEWVVFRKHLNKAWEILEEAETLETKDPDIYRLFMIVGKGLDKSELIMEKKFTEGVKVAKDYSDFYVERAGGLEPRWGGSSEALVGFTDRALELTKDTEGYFVYARIALCMYDPSCADFMSYGFSYDKIKQGHIDVLNKYPKSIYWLNSYCLFASLYKDKETAQEYFEKVGDNYYSYIWQNDYEFYQSCKKWAFSEN